NPSSPLRRFSDHSAILPPTLVPSHSAPPTTTVSFGPQPHTKPGRVCSAARHSSELPGRPLAVSGEPERGSASAWKGGIMEPRLHLIDAIARCPLSRSQAMTPKHNDELLALPFSEEIAELPVLLSGSQARQLEEAAHERGLTVGEVIRRLVREFLQRGCRQETGLNGQSMRRRA